MICLDNTLVSGFAVSIWCHFSMDQLDKTTMLSPNTQYIENTSIRKTSSIEVEIQEAARHVYKGNDPCEF